MLQSSLIRYQTEGSRTRIQCRFENETIRLTQALLGELFQTGVRTINDHAVNIFEEGELSLEATIREFRMVRDEGALAEAATCKEPSEGRQYPNPALCEVFNVGGDVVPPLGCTVATEGAA